MVSIFLLGFLSTPNTKAPKNDSKPDAVLTQLPGGWGM